MTSGGSGPAPSARRSIGTVGIALLLATALGAVLPVVCARLMPAADYQFFLGFWGLLFGIGSALSPVEQEVSRQAAVASVTGAKVAGSAAQVVILVAAMVSVFGLLVVLPPVATRLFGTHDALAWFAALGGVAFAFQFGVRGVLVGQQRITSYGGLVITEALLRVVLLGVVVLAGLIGMYPLALAVAAGSFAWLFFVRRAARMVELREGHEPWGVVARRMSTLLLSSGLTACVITGYPAMVNLLAPTGKAEAVAGLFAALTVARFPLLLLSPVQALAVPTVVRLSTDADGSHRLRWVVVKGGAAAFALAALGAVVGGLVGPAVVSLVFGGQYQVDGYVVAGLVWSSVLLAGVLLLAAVLVARRQVDRVLLVWSVVAGLSAAALLLGPADTVTRATLGLVVAPTVGAVIGIACVLQRPAVRQCSELDSDDGPPAG